jgi:hypothetical protein
MGSPVFDVIGRWQEYSYAAKLWLAESVEDGARQ